MQANGDAIEHGKLAAENYSGGNDKKMTEPPNLISFPSLGNQKWIDGYQ